MEKTTRHFIFLQNTKQKLVECQCSLKTALDSICVYRKSTSTFLGTSRKLEGGGGGGGGGRWRGAGANMGWATVFHATWVLITLLGPMSRSSPDLNKR